MSAPGDAGIPLPHPSEWHLINVIAHTMDDLPKLTKATFIGIMVAITGNILISLALNLQKLAHIRVEAQLRANRTQHQVIKTSDSNNTPMNKPQHKRSDRPSLDEHDEDSAQPNTPLPPGSSRSSTRLVETEHLIPFPQSRSPTTDYGATSQASNLEASSPQFSLPPNATFFSRIVPAWFRKKKYTEPPLRTSVMPVDVVNEETISNRRHKGQKTKTQKQDLLEDGNETEYLKSKLWWLGFLLMNIGEMGNFISYAWAPASVVAPLGTFSLIANCMLAPLLLGERFRKRDIFGILIAILGAVTARLDPKALVRAISQTPFVVYSCVYFGGAIVLATLSYGEIGRQWVFVDVGLCALFGGFTVLSTKAISTLLTMEWLAMFSNWITYPVLAVLAITGVGQIRYLNRALMRFDSKVVIPVQFVLFTLSAITGSAILYGDFRKAKFHQIVTFLYGCAATFLGVFIIAWAPRTEADTDPEGGGNPNSPDGRSITSEDERRLGLGSIGRRRATLIIPNGVKDAPILRTQQSAISLIGLSPAQHLLLVHTPPRDFPISNFSQPTFDRRRTMSWLGDSRRETTSPGGTQENSMIGRLRSSVGSYDRNTHR